VVAAAVLLALTLRTGAPTGGHHLPTLASLMSSTVLTTPAEAMGLNVQIADARPASMCAAAGAVANWRLAGSMPKGIPTNKAFGMC
jgi:hypothetical protein